MSRLVACCLLAVALALPACGESPAISDPCKDHCSNGWQDCGETDTDCGRDCRPCGACDGTAHCWNGRQDCGETSTDCGGDCYSCAPCSGTQHCSNGKQDCGETAADCGGDCVACTGCTGTTHCSNGKQDCGETGTDCGGDCRACAGCTGTTHCSNGKQDCGETGTDCGGGCKACAVGDAEFVSQNVPSKVGAGATFEVEITMRNTGSTTWDRVKEFRLGSQGPMDNKTWGTTRIYMAPGATVAPKQSSAFKAKLTAPKASGRYAFQWQMVRDGVGWFGQKTALLQVEVSATDPCAGTAHCSNRKKDCGETGVDCGGGCHGCGTEVVCGAHCAFPTIAAASSTRVVMVWADHNAHSLRYRCHDGKAWSSHKAVVTRRCVVDYPRMSVDRKGRFHLVWHEKMGSKREVHYALFGPGQGCAGSWTASMRLDTGQENSCWPQIAVGANDIPHVTWTEDYREIHYTRRETKGWLKPVVIVKSAHESCHSDVAVSGTRPGLLWMEGTAPRLPAFCEEKTGATGSFGAPLILDKRFHGWPQLETDSGGNFHAFYTHRGSTGGVKHRIRRGGKWSPERIVSNGPTAYTVTHLVSTGSKVYGAWGQMVKAPGGKDDLKQVFLAEAAAPDWKWTTPRQVSSGATAFSRFPFVAADSAAGVYVVWMLTKDGSAETGQVLFRKMP